VLALRSTNTYRSLYMSKVLPKQGGSRSGPLCIARGATLTGVAIHRYVRTERYRAAWRLARRCRYNVFRTEHRASEGPAEGVVYSHPCILLFSSSGEGSPESTARDMPVKLSYAPVQSASLAFWTQNRAATAVMGASCMLGKKTLGLSEEGQILSSAREVCR